VGEAVFLAPEPERDPRRSRYHAGLRYLHIYALLFRKTMHSTFNPLPSIGAYISNKKSLRKGRLLN